MAKRDAGAREEEHFSEQDWVDFARQRGDLEHRARVAAHLEAGCPRCEEAVRIWSAVLAFADHEPSYEPPPPAVVQMKRRFSLQRQKPLRERIASQVALVFDSFRQPLPAGVRATGLLPRYLLYKAGRYAI